VNPQGSRLGDGVGDLELPGGESSFVFAALITLKYSMDTN
jgi:hypothetical protein